MRKRFLTLLVFSLVVFSSVNFGQRLRHPVRVPEGKTYVYLDKGGREIARRRSGQSTTTTGITDCAKIPCPSTFDKDVVCWKCEKRPDTVQR